MRQVVARTAVVLATGAALGLGAVAVAFAFGLTLPRDATTRHIPHIATALALENSPEPNSVVTRVEVQDEEGDEAQTAAVADVADPPQRASAPAVSAAKQQTSARSSATFAPAASDEREVVAPDQREVDDPDDSEVAPPDEHKDGGSTSLDGADDDADEDDDKNRSESGTNTWEEDEERDDD